MPVPRAENAWGMIYSTDNTVPRAYLSYYDKFYLVRHRGSLQVESESTVHKYRDKTLVRISKKEPFFSNEEVSIRVKAMSKDIVTDDQIVLKRLSVEGGKCKVTIRSMDVSFMFEAFYDERRSRSLSELGRDYRIISKLGSGSYGSVYRALYVPTDHFCAVKAEPRDRRSRLRVEYDLMRSLSHPGVVRCHELRVGVDYLYLGMEVAEGGSMMNRIRKGPRYDEGSARHLFRQLLAALTHIHERGILHRDLKPENVVLTSGNRFCGAKLVDFGLGCRVSDRREMTRTVGTVSHMAPEMMHNLTRSRNKMAYTTKIDVWGLGVCAYEALCDGRMPFDDDGDDEHYKREMMRGRIRRDRALYRDLSSRCRDLIEGCLESDYRRRFSAAEALHHSWFTTR